MSEMTMIERVARAMQQQTVNKPFSWEDAARAGIEAMRPATVDMSDAGDSALENGADADTVWEAMIDEALCESDVALSPAPRDTDTQEDGHG